MNTGPLKPLQLTAPRYNFSTAEVIDSCDNR